MDKNDPNFSAYMNYDIGCDPIIGDPNMFNPCMQYEQAYMYYRYMSSRTDDIISLVLVLPTLPVMPTTLISRFFL